MYLKKIEVQGFKSFANKLVFEFDNGITGIVGPNGSGKSNIADAVRWVLGEQSAKQLRGSKMEDIIFAGTELRKPVSFATVSLTIDNSDHQLDIEYDEVTVARRVFRSGESEYMLNGNLCRLRDVHELFYDTGIGKEGYSIIGQGQIDRILSGKPEERRELFDEAAGIVKYKRRKNAAQKSLDNESQNLVRINDILAELEKQVGPLSRQSEKAKEYLRLKDALKQYEVNLFLLESDSIKAETEENASRLAIVDNQYQETKQRFDEIKKIYDEKDVLMQEVTAQLEALTEQFNKAQIDKSRLESQIEILKEQIRSAKQSDTHLAERLAAIDEQIADRDEEKKTLLAQKFSIEEEIDTAFAKKNDADQAVRTQEEQIEATTLFIEEQKNLMMDYLNQKGTIRSDIKRYETMAEQIQIRKSELAGKLIGFKTDESEYGSSLDSLQKELDTINTEIQKRQVENNRLEIVCNDTRQNRSEDKNQLAQVREQHLRTVSRLDSLKNIAERYDGYGNSIRKVMECREQNKGILGVVADLIKTEKQYEIAIETALGGTIQNIVTDSEDTAKKMIAYLKENKFGRATFLPLNAINAKQTQKNDLAKETGVIGYASELVRTNAEYRNLAQYLLGRCVVVDHIDHALQLNRKYSYTLKIVTLEGELLNPGGSMTGGAFKNTSNLLGRRREIEELEKVIAKTEQTIQALNQKIEEADRTISEAKAAMEQNQEALQKLLLNRNTVQMNYNQAAEKQAELQTMYEDNRREEQDIRRQMQEIKEQLAALEEQLHETENANTNAAAAIEEKTKLLEQMKLSLAEKTKAAESVHIEYSQISQRASFAEESVKRVLREIDRLKESITELQDSKEDSQKEIDRKNAEITQIQDTILLAADTILAQEKQLNELKQQKEELNDSMKGFFAAREECQGQVLELEKEQFRLTQSKEKLETAKDARIEYMWNEYEITFSQAASLRNPDLGSESEIKKQVSELKGQIRRLGDVNVNAIEDYKDVSERYEFLKTQHDDLIIARDKLIAVIEELDTGMRTRFAEKFEAIKLEYDKVFKQLFGGGKGTIALEPDVDILEADITIISQPPGKKLQNMMQLSGGEKALSAICLLFAIQNLKPSPFCLLDEIEAALDDSNVDRFAKYLHNLTKKTQFIVITHRRGTMASADRLYGITMQEKGVSTLVSVDLIEKQLEEPARA